MTSLGAPNSNSSPITNWVFPVVIAILALVDGAIHLSLDFLVFHGNFFGAGSRPTPPPGAPGAHAGPLVPLPLPLNELFLLNFIGYVVLAALILTAPRWLGSWQWLMDVVLFLYVAAVFLGWLDMGRPNPFGLAYASKGIEIVLVVALVAHVWSVLTSRPVQSATS